MRRLFITLDFLREFSTALFHHIGWSERLNRYVVVEPVCSIRIRESKLTGCVDVDGLVHGMSGIGSETARLLDLDLAMADYYEQVIGDDLQQPKAYVLVCDNPVLFPYERLPRFLAFLETNPLLISDVAGIAHYHIQYEGLSAGDIHALAKYAAEISRLGGSAQLGLVISHVTPEPMLAMVGKGEEAFAHFFIEEAARGSLVLSGSTFSSSGKEELEVALE